MKELIGCACKFPEHSLNHFSVTIGVKNMRESNFYELSQKTQRKAKQTLLTRYRKYVGKKSDKKSAAKAAGMLGCWAVCQECRTSRADGKECA